MNRPDFSDEDLMRFADGELDADTATALERAMETDDALVSRAALFIETRRAAKTALAPMLDEPVPAHVTEAVTAMVAEKRAAAKVVPLRRQPSRDPIARGWQLPVAASIAAVVGGLCGYWLANGGASAPADLHVGGVGKSVLEEALATVASGEERQLPDSGRRFRAIASFRDSGQALCREFEIDSPDRSTVVSVACRSGAAWLVTFAVAAPGGDDGYAPASSTDALEAYLAAIHAGPAMEAADEARALDAVRNTGPK